MYLFEFIFFTFMLSARVSFITRFGLDLNKRRSRRSFGEQGRAGQGRQGLRAVSLLRSDKNKD